MSPTLTRLVRPLFAAALALAAAMPLQAQEFEKNILTGSPSGTYIQFGRNIADVAAECGLTLNVRESAGSLENFIGVRQRANTQFGIVQSDVLEYLSTFSADDPAIARAIRGVRIAYPLYDEEVHILARNDISGLAGLEGTRVAIGVEDSGTFLTASLVLDLAGIEPAARVTIGPDEALDQLIAGEIDAFFYVAGAPTNLFLDDRISAERFRLVPVEDPVLSAVYQATELPGNTYPFQSEPVPGIAVKAVLMTYEYVPNRNAYHRASCEAVSDITNLILTRFDQLRETGHPKWSQVDLSDLPPRWEVGSCVNSGLQSDYVGANCGGGSARASSSENAANAAYRARICETFGC